MLNFFFFNDTATTEIYTLSLHDALPISLQFEVASAQKFGNAEHDLWRPSVSALGVVGEAPVRDEHIPNWYGAVGVNINRSEEHTSELQSQSNLVCRLLLEKKKKKQLRISIV